MISFPVLHCLPKFAQIHVHWFDDAIEPSYPLLPSFPFVFKHFQHQGLFQWVCSLHQVAKVLDLQLQYQSYQWIFRVDFLYDWLLWSPCSPRDSQESSPTPQFESINSLALSLLYGPTLTYEHDYWKNHSLTVWTSISKVMSPLFNMQSRSIIIFLPRNKNFWISQLQSPSTVILEQKKKKNTTVSFFIFPPICLPWINGARYHDRWFFNSEFLSHLFYSLLLPSSRGYLIPLWCLPLEWYNLHTWG